ncbi:MAG: hypothetical protein HYV45_01945 [Candidatus Moranbacteria bacterium]|nr:hypothetical protein [Candidatus Moranbacteria bacterium]
MILKAEHRKKYKKKLGWDEELIRFAVKIVGSAALFFLFAVGVDVYRFFY